MHLPLVQLSPHAAPDLQARLVHLHPGTVIVLRQHLTTPTLILDYEGGLYERPADRPARWDERTQYALRAGGRAARHYPTMARLHFSIHTDQDRPRQPNEFVQEGVLDTDSWQVTWFLQPIPLLTFPPPTNGPLPKSGPPPHEL